MNDSRPTHRRLLLLFLAAFLLVFAGGANAAERVSGPYEHYNLAVYLVHGDAAALGATDEVVTLDAALAAGHVIVHETGNVNELSVENTSRDQTVFLQAGDIVKGGKQDRVLSHDLVLGPQSGKVPIAAFCVERGRWNARAGEDVSSFGSSKHALSSKELKLAARRAKSQQDVWNEVAALQGRLAAALDAPVASPESQTSLQLTLENAQLAETKQAYVNALATLASGQEDAIGFAIAINGTIQTAEVYAQPGLFRAQWAKQLDAAATEAISGMRSAGDPAPETAAVETFLRTTQRGEAIADDRPNAERSAARETANAVFFESRTSAAPESWLHRSYITK